MSGPLQGIRVLDMTRQLAGPWAAQMLGDLGADVIKVERPGAGDEVRSFGPPFIPDKQGKDTRESPFFFAGNRNKRSITVNLAHAEGQTLIRSLARHCDVVIENYRVGTLDRYGLGYSDLSGQDSSLIYCSVTGFGQTGPYKDQAGYDSIFQAMCGLMSVNGIPDGEPGSGPMRVGVAMADIMTGMYSSVAILGALHHRTRTGEGQHIDMALFDVQVASLTIENMRYLLLGEVPTRTGNVSRNLVPTQLFDCIDGQVSITIGNDDQFGKLARFLGRPEWSTDSRFATGSARRSNRHEIVALVADEFGSRHVDELVRGLSGAGVPCGPVNTIAQVFEDVHLQHRKLRREVEHEALGPVPLVANPIRYSRTEIDYRLAPPMLGQHTREVLSELLGLPPAEADRLAAAGAI